MKEIVQNSFTEFCKLIQSLICMGIQYLAYVVLDDDTFTPSLDTFITGNNGYGGVLSQEAYDNIQRAFIYVALSLTILLLVIHLGYFLFSGAMETKDTVWQLIFFTIIAFFLTYNIVSFFNLFMDFGKGVFKEAFQSSENNILDSFTLDSNTISDNFWSQLSQSNENATSALINTDFLEVLTIGFGDNLFLIFNVILQIIFFSIVIYNFAKLVFEYVKRYIMMCILHLGSPLACPFIISADTRNVLFSYAKMFGTEIGVLLFTKLWLYVSLHSMYVMSCSFINMCIMITIITFGVKVENFVKELGLTASNMGPALLDSIAATGATMAIIATKAKSSTGEAMINAGGAFGNLGLTTLGSALTGNPMSFESRTRAMHESAGAQVRQAMTKNSNASDLTSSQKKAMDRAVTEGGLFRNIPLQNVLSGLNKAGYKEAMEHLASSEFGSLKDALGDPNASITPTAYSQNAGLGFEYKSGINGLTRTGFISDAPKTGNGITSIPLEMGNGHMAYANFDPVSMDALHNSGVDTIYNTDGEVLGNGMTTMELDTGFKMDQFTYAGDTDATHYAASINNMGGLDILYNSEGINHMNANNSKIVGAITKDGFNLKTSDYKWGNNGEMSPIQDIHNTLTSGSWSNMGLSDIKPQDIKYDANSGVIQFAATNNITGKRSGYTAIPSVNIQNEVRKGNTVTDSVHGSYTFSKSSNKFEGTTTTDSHNFKNNDTQNFENPHDRFEGTTTTDSHNFKNNDTQNFENPHNKF